MVWLGVLRNGMIWHGIVNGMVWYGMVWYGIVWYCMVWYGMVWYGMVWYGMVWYGMVWYGMVCYAMLCYAMLCYAMLWHAMLSFAMACHRIVSYRIISIIIWQKPMVLERSCSVVECSTRDQGVTGLSLTGFTVLCPLTINPAPVHPLRVRYSGDLSGNSSLSGNSRYRSGSDTTDRTPASSNGSYTASF